MERARLWWVTRRAAALAAACAVGVAMRSMGASRPHVLPDGVALQVLMGSIALAGALVVANLAKERARGIGTDRHGSRLLLFAGLVGLVMGGGFLAEAQLRWGPPILFAVVILYPFTVGLGPVIAGWVGWHLIAGLRRDASPQRVAGAVAALGVIGYILCQWIAGTASC